MINENWLKKNNLEFHKKMIGLHYTSNSLFLVGSFWQNGRESLNENELIKYGNDWTQLCDVRGINIDDDDEWYLILFPATNWTIQFERAHHNRMCK